MHSTAEAGVVVLSELEEQDASGALLALARAATPNIPGVSMEALARGFAEREALGSTAIGGGVALPHCRCPELERPLYLIARAPEGIAFGAPDGAPVRIFVAVVTPAGSPAEHLQALAQLAHRLREAVRVEELLTARDSEAILAAWRRPSGAAA